MHWPISQICPDGRLDWNEVPQPGQKLSTLKTPAAQLELMPTGGGAHAH